MRKRGFPQEGSLRFFSVKRRSLHASRVYGLGFAGAMTVPDGPCSHLTRTIGAYKESCEQAILRMHLARNDRHMEPSHEYAVQRMYQASTTGQWTRPASMLQQG